MKDNNSINRINRRKFLSYSAVAGAGMLAPGISLGGLKSMQSNDLNVAILGAGAQGQVLLNSMLKIPGLRFKAVCDIWTSYNQRRVSRLLKKYGHELNTYVDYREMLANEKDLDVVIIATPDFWHAEHAIACLKAGLHVYCEKEMSTSLAKAKQMVLTARETGKLLQIGHQRRSNPRYIHCYDNVIKEARLLGQVTAINAQWNRAVQPDLGWPKKYAVPPNVLKQYGFKSMHQFRNWRWFKGLGGGPIVDLGSHQIDIFSWFLDAMPTSVMASGGVDYYDKKLHEWYDTVMAVFEFETKDGLVRAFYQTLTTNSNQGYFETFMGDHGTLNISESAARGGIYKERSAPEWQKWIDLGYIDTPVVEEAPISAAILDVRETVAPPQHGIPIEFNDPYHKPHLDNFFNTVRGNDTLNCPGEIGYETAVAVLKVNDAVEAGRKIKFNAKEFHI